MADDEKSNRQRRKDAREGARRLRNDPAWQALQRDPQERLRELDQRERDARVYADATGCEQCDALRAESGDETALCPDHLAEAMGF